MSTGLIALLDDIATLAKVAAASLDDAAAQATKAGSKAAGIVIDDAAVTPRYVVGFAAERELPIIGKIARGSLKNKLLFILPAALALSFLAPWVITPILMIGGAYLCMEGYHKVLDLIRPHDAHGEEAAVSLGDTPEEVENRMVASAIRTDFILSAEIMVISLSTVAALSIWMQAGVLAVVGVVMTILVYGAVALIVKADDVGVHMARGRTQTGRAIGRGIVAGMPHFLKALSLIGMVAMLWVGGGIVIHGLHGLGWHAPEDVIHHAAEAAAQAAGPLAGFVSWLVSAGIAAIVGIGIGLLVDPFAKYVAAPIFLQLRGAFPRAQSGKA